MHCLTYVLLWLGNYVDSYSMYLVWHHCHPPLHHTNLFQNRDGRRLEHLETNDSPISF